MITVIAGGEFTAIVGNCPTGIGSSGTAQLGITIRLAADQSIVVARTTAGIHEANGSGNYDYQTVAPNPSVTPTDYIIEWDQGAASSPPGLAVTELLTVTGVPVVNSIVPTLSQVAALMRSRTVVEGTAGTELGTFDSTTRPTDVEANVLIDQAVLMVENSTGQAIPEQFFGQVRTIVAIQAAMLIELSFYQNEIASERSTLPMFQLLLKNGLSGLINALNMNTPDSTNPGFFAIPIINRQQAKFLHRKHATIHGVLHPELLPADETWPYGLAGLEGLDLEYLGYGLGLGWEYGGDGLAFLTAFTG
jgi:hypothetical protein